MRATGTARALPEGGETIARGGRAASSRAACARSVAISSRRNA
ncbi:MAG: hypothetical protein QM688_11135 [Sphingomonas bacterium]